MSTTVAAPVAASASAPAPKRRRSRKRAAAEVEEDQPVVAVVPSGPQSLDDSTNQSNNQSNNQENNQSINQSTNQSTNQHVSPANKRGKKSVYKPKVIVYNATSNDVPNFSGKAGLPADAKFLLERLPPVIWRHSILPFLSVQTIFEHMIPVNKFFYLFAQPLLHCAVDIHLPGVCQAKGEFEQKAHGRKVINATKNNHHRHDDDDASKVSVPLSPREIAWIISKSKEERTSYEAKNDIEMDLTRPTISKTQANSKFCVTINQLDAQRKTEAPQNFRNHRFRLSTVIKLMFDRFGSLESMEDYQQGKQSRPRRASYRRRGFGGLFNLFGGYGGGGGIHGPGCRCGMEDDDEDDMFGMLFGGFLGGRGMMSDYDSEDLSD